MKKDIYKNVPQGFHDQFMDTIEQIASQECMKAHKVIGLKRTAILIAALVAALSTLTVGAAYLLKWHQTAARNLGVSEELADKLVMEGAAKEERTVFSAEDVTIQAIQSVATDTYYYILLSVATPESIVIDEDTIFDSVEVTTAKGTESAVINYVNGSFADNVSLWELEIRAEAGMNYAGTPVSVKIADLVQTAKTETVKTLAEGEWTLSITLPLQPKEALLCQESVLKLGTHEVNISRTEVGPFQIRLYGKQEELKHALQYNSFNVNGVEYLDGTIVEQNIELRSTAALGIDSESGEVYINIPLETAVDVSKVKGVLVEDKEMHIVDISTDDMQDLTIIYERYGHVTVHDEKRVYLWDQECGMVSEIADLAAIGYSPEQGGEIKAGPGGKTIYILPDGESDKVYIADVEYGLDKGENLHQMDKEGNWPE